MAVPVVAVRVVLVGMGGRLMDVLVLVPPIRPHLLRNVVVMLVMPVVGMPVVVCKFLMGVFVFVAFAEMEPNTDSH